MIRPMRVPDDAGTAPAAAPESVALQMLEVRLSEARGDDHVLEHQSRYGPPGEREGVDGELDRAADRTPGVADVGLAAQQHRPVRTRWPCCSAAQSLRACIGSTRLSLSKMVNSTAG